MTEGTATAFGIAAIEAFHLVAPDRTYWSGFKADSRTDTGRFQLKPGWRTVYGRRVETAIVKVTLDDGSIGFGEATEPICPEVICRLAAGLIAPVLGDTRFEHPAALWDAAYDLQRGRGHVAGYYCHAMAAIDVAVWDALARRAGLPLARLLSPAAVAEVPVYASGIRRGTRAERIEALGALVAEGLTAVKIFGSADTAETAAEVEGLRAGVPGDWALMVDALWSYPSVEAAAEGRRVLGNLGVGWLECPIVPEDLAGHRRLAAGEGAPIALGEHFFTHHQSRDWLEAGALHMFQPDVCRTGISDGLRQAAIARRHGIGVTPHMGSGSPLIHAAALHFWAAVAADAPCEYQIDLADLLPDVFDSGWRYSGGRLPMPERAGLGVTVDEAGLAAVSTGIERWPG